MEFIWVVEHTVCFDEDEWTRMVEETKDCLAKGQEVSDIVYEELKSFDDDVYYAANEELYEKITKALIEAASN